MRDEVTPDIQKSNALVKMAEISFERLQLLPFQKYPSNALVDLYDVIHKYLDAICSKKGLKFRGDGAHYELIVEIGDWEVLSSSDISLLQQLCSIRNRIQYEGFFVEVEYLNRSQTRILSIIKSLQKVLK